VISYGFLYSAETAEYPPSMDGMARAIRALV
ncbi:MAG: hypothetical protein QOI83_1274, partial [Streptomycetaceae bacterium]|nr:hypothetical protein [Streptomycetaceae bacterium]